MSLSKLPNSKKRKVLDLNERVDIISQYEKGAKCIKLAKDYNVGKTQIQNICIRDKEAIMSRFKLGESGKRKTIQNRKCPYQMLNEHQWKVRASEEDSHMRSI